MKLPLPEGIPTNFGADRPFDHVTREIELETRRHSVSVNFDKFETYKTPDFVNAKTIAAHFHEAIHTDRVKKDTQASFSFISVPKGIRASILCRMFGDDGEEAPRWWPECLRAKVRPRMRIISNSYHAETDIHYQRVCPHQGEQGHGNFLFGPELTFADRGLKNDLYAAAERSRGDDFTFKVRDLIHACRRNDHDPTLISLGRREMSLLLYSGRLGGMSQDCHQDLPPRPDKRFEFMGLKIEEVDKDTYLSIV